MNEWYGKGRAGFLISYVEGAGGQEIEVVYTVPGGNLFPCHPYEKDARNQGYWNNIFRLHVMCRRKILLSCQVLGEPDNLYKQIQSTVFAN